MTLGEIIKKYRKEHGNMSQAAFASLSKMSKGYISMLENNRNPATGEPIAPTYTTFEKVAKVLKCSPNDIMRLMDDRQLIAVNQTLAQPEHDAETAQAVFRDIDPIYDALNREGQQVLCDYGRYLGTQEQYQADDLPEVQPTFIRHYIIAAAAGYAAPIEGEDYELVPRDVDTPAKADFSINIAGDSMEPYIKDGQRVYVQRDVSLAQFEVGIFFVDGDVYCKQWCPSYDGSIYLLSANPRREDANVIIPADSGRNIVCFGKVILPNKLPAPSYF